MNASHVAGGGFGAVVGGLIVGVLGHFFGVKVSDVDAAFIGSATLSAGVGLGHALSAFGVRGIASVLWRGRPKPEAPAPPAA